VRVKRVRFVGKQRFVDANAILHVPQLPCASRSSRSRMRDFWNHSRST
jgi:hypothetical protein